MKLDISVAVQKSPKFRAGDCSDSKATYRVGDLQKLISDINWKFYLAAAGLGALSSVFFEQIAFTFDLWLYDEGMPVLPFLGTGLLTFLHLTILVPV